MKIILDCYGGDNSPQAHIEGAIKAIKQRNDLQITLVGKSEEIRSVLEQYDFDENRIDVLNADEVIGCDEKPTQAIRDKKMSSLVVSYDLLKNDEEYGALVSSGSTGAILAGAILKLGRIKGISRPALAPLLPTKVDKKLTMLIDCGANAECKAINLLHFALMGYVYYKEVLKVEHPKVALLSNGTEDEKGNTLVKESFELIKDLKGIEFCGNAEARDLLSGDYDIFVTDGFSGNIALKSAEGAIKLCLSTIKSEIKSSFIAKLGALCMKGVFKNVKKKIDYNSLGGAVVLGAIKPVIKAHGSSSATAIEASLLQAYDVVKGDIITKIKTALEGIDNADAD